MLLLFLLCDIHRLDEMQPHNKRNRSDDTLDLDDDETTSAAATENNRVHCPSHKFKIKCVKSVLPYLGCGQQRKHNEPHLYYSHNRSEISTRMRTAPRNKIARAHIARLY